MNEPQITLVGNVARLPRLRAVPSGVLVADFRLACTPRRYDKASDSWSDLDTLWFGVTCWRQLAENAAASLQKGDRVVVTGRLATRAWKGEDGVERSGLEVEATSVGLDLSRGTAQLQRTARGGAPQDGWSPPVQPDPHGAEASSPSVADLPVGDLVEPDEEPDRHRAGRHPVAV